MKLTSKGRYAVMALVDLARFDSINPVSLRDISLRQGISLDYLEQIFSKLKKSQASSDSIKSLDLMMHWTTHCRSLTLYKHFDWRSCASTWFGSSLQLRSHCHTVTFGSKD